MAKTTTVNSPLCIQVVSSKEAANERAEEATKQGRKTVKVEGEAGQDDACKVSTNFGIRKARSAARCPLL